MKILYERTGEFRPPLKGEWFDSGHGDGPIGHGHIVVLCSVETPWEYWILRRIEVAHKERDKAFEMEEPRSEVR